MAHGMLSDLPIEYGIYSDLFGCIFFTLFSTSRHTSAGSAAFLMMIIGSSIETNFGSEAERNLFSPDRTFSRISDRSLWAKADWERLQSVTVEDKLNYIRNIGIFVGLIQFGLRYGISGPSDDLEFYVRVLISNSWRNIQPFPSFLLVYFKLVKYRNFYPGKVLSFSTL